MIAGLIPIHLHLQKLSNRVQLRAHSLSHNYILQLLLESRLVLCNNPYCFSLDLLISCQWKMIKGSIIDMDNRFNKVFPSFDPHNKEFSPSSWIIDIFPSWFFFTLLTSVAKTILYLTYANLMTYWLCLHWISLILLLLLTLVSKIMWPSLLLTFISMTNLSSKLYIILWILQPQKLNFLPLDVASIRPLVFIVFLKLLLLQIHSIPLEEFLILHYIHSKYTLYPF